MKIIVTFLLLVNFVFADSYSSSSIKKFCEEEINQNRYIEGMYETIFSLQDEVIKQKKLNKKLNERLNKIEVLLELKTINYEDILGKTKKTHLSK